MKELILIVLWLLPLAAQTQKKTESFWDKLLRIAGVSATPSSLRGDDQVSSGDVWVVAIAQKSVPRRLTHGGGYISPVFDARGQNVLALKGGDVYRIPLTGNPPIKLYTFTDVTKLVGVSRDDPDQLLVLSRDAQHLPFAALLSIRSGALVRIPHDPHSHEDQVMLAHLAGWERVYGDALLYTEKNEREGAAGTVEFSDVYFKRARGSPINLTNGNGVSSGQPSLSTEGERVAFIRGGR
jgi:hypothetical protein